MKTKITFLLFNLFLFFSLRASDIPAWYPSDYNLSEAVEAATQILRDQGMQVDDTVHVNKIIFSDADHTLLKTQTPILLKNKTTGQLFKDPETKKVLRLPNRSFLEALENLKKRYPNQPWDEFEIDFNEMGSIVAIDVTPPIEHIIDILKCSDKSKNNKEFIITARSSTSVAPAMEDYFKNFDLELDGTFAVNNPEINSLLKLQGQGLSAAHKKAITMAALIKLYSPKEVSFYDDGDDNLQAAMDLLPGLFPDLPLRFYDIIHIGQSRFKLSPVAFTRLGGVVISSCDGRVWSKEEIRSYSSKDAPLPDEL